MRIIVCGSMSAAKEMVFAKEALSQLGHDVVIPEFSEEYAGMALIDKKTTESARDKLNHDLIRNYYKKIESGDAILVLNIEKNEIQGYVGANAFLEMGFAHIQNKKIFLLNPHPNSWHADEINAMQPIVLNGSLENLK